MVFCNPCPKRSSIIKIDSDRRVNGSPINNQVVNILTGKSNTVKKVIEATTEISNKATNTCINVASSSAVDNVKQFADDGIPKYKVGQYTGTLGCLS